jgi:hypothetical protein
MEHETTTRETRDAKSIKSTLTTIIKFNTALCAIFAAIWTLANLLHQHANPLTGLFGIGLMLGLLTTISALNAKLRVEWEEPDSDE